MYLAKRSQETSLYLLARLGLAQWVQIITINPSCTYYFGPFITIKEAKLAQWGYIDDLLEEGAEILSVDIKQCKPRELTVLEDELAENSYPSSPEFSR
jgi:hypothetical protein